MVICCVPGCCTDSWKCDGSVTFYDFPCNPDLRAKWIKQINAAIKAKTMWLPRGKPALCSKHFLHTDFKGDTDSLRPGSIPTVFGHKYIGQDPESYNENKLQETKQSPLIVKVLRPQTSIIENKSKLRISDDCSVTIEHGEIENEAGTEGIETDKTNLPSSSFENNAKSNPTLNINPSYINKNNLHSLHNSMNLKSNHQSSSVSKISTPEKHNITGNAKLKSYPLSNSLASNNPIKISSSKQPNLIPKKNVKKKENVDLIEIGPNTFLKINPDVIKVNKKQTPSGNTVLQFLMDQKLVKNYTDDMLPKLIQSIPPPSNQENKRSDVAKEAKMTDTNNTEHKNGNGSVQHVLGHVVDNHVCEESCNDLTLEDDEIEAMDVSPVDATCKDTSMNETSDNQSKDNNTHNRNVEEDLSNNADKSVLEKAPVLLTTNMPLSHCFIDRPKYILQLKQKNRQLASLKLKISTLNKKIEELEDRCIVQERQLSYSFVKRLKAIQKNAAKGDPSATYILEQIRSYAYVNNSKMRWSDSTLTQCAIWCRKAPYAYEYFKKGNFFKLPCLGTVKRFIKKHPELNFQRNVAGKSASQDEGGGEDDDGGSSSDFDFDEVDAQNDDMSEDENNASETCEAMLSDVTAKGAPKKANSKNLKNKRDNKEIQKATESIANTSPKTNIQETIKESDVAKKPDAPKSSESNAIPFTVDTSNVELQEIVLPSGEVVQCYSSNIVSGGESGQYFIIPNVNDQGNAADHEYNVVQAESMPVILQNIENSQLHMQQDQLIFIANSSDQVECSETEVISA